MLYLSIVRLALPEPWMTYQEKKQAIPTGSAVDGGRESSDKFFECF